MSTLRNDEPNFETDSTIDLVNCVATSSDDDGRFCDGRIVVGENGVCDRQLSSAVNTSRYRAPKVGSSISTFKYLQMRQNEHDENAIKAKIGSILGNLHNFNHINLPIQIVGQFNIPRGSFDKKCC
jgi:hypothetical protein